MKFTKCCTAALLTILSANMVYGGALKKMFVKDSNVEHIQPDDHSADKGDNDTAAQANETVASEENKAEETSSTEAKPAENKPAEEKKEITGDPVVAKIGSTEIRRSDILKEIQKLPPNIVKSANAEQLFIMARDQFVSTQLMQKAAKKMGLDKDAQFIERLNEIKDRLTVESYIAKNIGNEAPSESVLKARYTKYLVEFKKQKESHVFHIVVDSEQKAKEVIEKLNKGADFKKMIEEHSLYKENATEGSWFVVDILPDALKTPLKALKNGEFTKEPVKMGNMFGIFKIDGSRDSEPMKYEDAKGVLSSLIMQEKLRDLILKLMKQYDAKVFKEDGSADTFSMSQIAK